MRKILPLLLLAGCSTTWDPHAPSTVIAPEKGGAVSVDHGDRLLVKLPPAAQGAEWRIREPMTMTVLAEGPADEQGQRMTPLRSGKSQLRFVEVPLLGEGAPQRELAYEVTVP